MNEKLSSLSGGPTNQQEASAFYKSISFMSGSLYTFEHSKDFIPPPPPGPPPLQMMRKPLPPATYQIDPLPNSEEKKLNEEGKPEDSLTSMEVTDVDTLFNLEIPPTINLGRQDIPKRRYSIGRSPPIALEDTQVRPPRKISAAFNRQALSETHILTPQFNKVAMAQLLRWISSLDVWPCEISLKNLKEECRSGLIFCNIIQKIAPKSIFKGLNKKALAFKAIEHNMGQVYATLSGHGVIRRRLATPKDLVEGKKEKIFSTFEEIFHKIALKTLRHKLNEYIIPWMNNVITKYTSLIPSLSLLERQTTGHDGSFSTLGSFLRSGTPLWCILHYYNYNPSKQDDDHVNQHLNAKLMWADPMETMQFYENIGTLFCAFRKFNVPLVWEVKDYVDHTNEDFLVVQMDILYEKYKSSETHISFDTNDGVWFQMTSSGDTIVQGLKFKSEEDEALNVINFETFSEDIVPATVSPLLKNPITEQQTRSKPSWNNGQVLPEHARNLLAKPKSNPMNPHRNGHLLAIDMARRHPKKAAGSCSNESSDLQSKREKLLHVIRQEQKKLNQLYNQLEDNIKELSETVFVQPMNPYEDPKEPSSNPRLRYRSSPRENKKESLRTPPNASRKGKVESAMAMAIHPFITTRSDKKMLERPQLSQHRRDRRHGSDSDSDNDKDNDRRSPGSNSETPNPFDTTSRPFLPFSDSQDIPVVSTSKDTLDIASHECSPEDDAYYLELKQCVQLEEMHYLRLEEERALRRYDAPDPPLLPPA